MILHYDRLLASLRTKVAGMSEPVSFLLIERYGRDPFLILISCILSLRTKDAVTYAASVRLFSHATTSQQIIDLPLQIIEQAIYPAGFYHRKALQIKKISHILVDRYRGIVPSDMTFLLQLPGVGSKTANLVLGLAFGIPALCVDIHVHRIANRLGLCATKTPEQTEIALKLLFPENTWIELNRLLVMFGQNVCVPVSPYCSTCPFQKVCPRRGVTKSR